MSEQTFYVPFRQYFRPDGRSTMINVATHKREVNDKAQAIIAAGFHFETELLATGVTSSTIGDRHGDYAYAFTPGTLDTITMHPKIEQMIMETEIDALKAQSEASR